MIWQLQDAKRKFSQVVNTALADGPQVITRHGKKVVVIMSFEDYKAAVKPKPALLQILQEASFEGDGLMIERDPLDFGRLPVELA